MGPLVLRPVDLRFGSLFELGVLNGFGTIWADFVFVRFGPISNRKFETINKIN